MEFNLKKSQIYKAILFSSFFSTKLSGFFRLGFLLLGAVFAVLFLVNRYVLVTFQLSWVGDDIFLGLMFIFLSFGLSLLFLEIFFESYLKYPPIKDGENLAEFLDFDSAKVLGKAVSISGYLKEEGVSTNSLLLALLDYSQAQNIFIRLGIDPKKLGGDLEKNLNLNLPTLRLSLFADNLKISEELTKLLVDSKNLGAIHLEKRITPMDLVVSLFDFNSTFKKLIIDTGLDKDDLNLLAIWYEKNIEFAKNRAKFWRLENLLRQPPIGVSWVYGNTWLLSHFAQELTTRFWRAEGEINLVGRKNVVDKMEEILARSGENNVLLVGEPGVGKRTVILGFAKQISEGKTLPSLAYKRVFELNVPLIASSSKDTAEIQKTLVAVLNEAIKAGNIVLVIEDFHNFIGARSGLGRIDVSEILLPFLESKDFQVIATTDPVSFHKYVETRPEIMKVFEKIDVEEPNEIETLKIIEEIIPKIEEKSKALATYGAIKKMVENAGKFIKTAPFPEKAIDLLAEVVSHVQSQNRFQIFPQDVDDVITEKTKIPLGKIGVVEKQKLVNLEAEMHKEIVGQEEAVGTVAKTLQRLRTGLTRGKKPAGVFLFIGPTGVGKTLTAKILAKTFFGLEEKMIRFDMTEYQDSQSLDRFLGSLAIGEPGQLVSQVREDPFSVLLLDEFEKSNEKIINLFLQVFDEGRMTDVFGRKVSFEQNIIIATSNAGSTYIRDLVNQGLDPATQREKVIDFLIRERYFSPELLNRFDEVVIFHPLTKEQLVKIAELQINKLAQRLAEQGYFFKPTPEIVDHIGKVGFDPQFGARPMERAIQDKIENAIAGKILDEKISKGVEFSLSLDEVKK